jgi:hypothetical protein
VLVYRHLKSKTLQSLVKMIYATNPPPGLIQFMDEDGDVDLLAFNQVKKTFTKCSQYSSLFNFDG